jgi:putative spermidine/putrescine transport system permease protein
MIGGVPWIARALGGILVAAILVYMLVPLAVVVGSSLSASEFLVFPPRGLSLRWYGEVLGSQKYLAAGWTSLTLAGLVTVLAVAIGTPAAIAVYRLKFRGAEALGALFLSPLILPTLIFAIGLLMLFSLHGGGPSFAALAVGHLVICLPYVVRTVGAALAAGNRDTEEAARVMGAKAWQRYWFVVLPECRAGIAAGAFFAFNISFDDAVVALFLRSPGLDTLPLRIYGELEFSPDPSVAAVSTLMIGISILTIVAIDRLFGLDRARM